MGLLCLVAFGEAIEGHKTDFKAKIETVLGQSGEFAAGNVCTPRKLSEVIFCFGLTWKERAAQQSRIQEEDEIVRAGVLPVECTLRIQNEQSSASLRFGRKPFKGKMYEEWLSHHLTETQQKVLGPAGYKLGLGDRVSLVDMFDSNGEPLTIDDLRAL